jgi:hypothetical protein
LHIPIKLAQDIGPVFFYLSLIDVEPDLMPLLMPKLWHTRDNFDKTQQLASIADEIEQNSLCFGHPSLIRKTSSYKA